MKLFSILIFLCFAGFSITRGDEILSPPPAEWNIPHFYSQAIEVEGFPIVASEKVNPYAVKEAA